MRQPLSSLRVRLLLLVLLPLVPAFILMLNTASEERSREIAGVQTNALQLARVAASDQEQLVDGTRQLLVALAQLPAVRTGDGTTCNTLFSALLNQYPWYVNLAVADATGDVWCSSVSLSGPVSVADRSYFQRALQTRDFAVGEYQVGRIASRDCHQLRVSHPGGPAGSSRRFRGPGSGMAQPVGRHGPRYLQRPR